jgi:hypothetical protein
VVTQVAAAPVANAHARTGRSRRCGRDVLRSGWPPAGVVLVLAIAVLHRYGVSVRETAVFGCFAVLCGTVPGTLLWRALRGGSRFFGEDVAAGTAVGHAITVLTYIPARWIGLPRLVLAWPVLTITVFLIVPKLRSYWRAGRRTGRVPVFFSWGLAALMGHTVVSSGTSFFRDHGLTWPGYGAPYVDMPFHLSLIGELKHHMPPTSPSVLGEPLYYHWFVYADMAATSWGTGIEPQTLLYRLFLLPVLASWLVLIAAIALRLTGRWWPGLVALALAGLVVGPNPWSWAPPLGGELVLRYGIPWQSPTHAFATTLFAAVVLLLVNLFRLPGAAAGRVPWTLLGILLAAVLGAKATFLPMLLVGLVAVVAGTFLVDRRLHRPALVAALATLVCLVFAQVVLFGGASDGAVVHPLSMFGTVAANAAATADPALTLRAVVVAAGAFGLCCVWAGLFGLVLRPKGPGGLLDPPILLLLGIGIAGFSAGMILRFPGDSQRYFLYGATPYLSLAAVCGLVAICPHPERLAVRSRTALAGAVAAGTALILVLRALNGSTRPAADEVEPRILVSLLLLLAICGALALALVAAGRRRPEPRRLAPALVVAFVAGLIVPSSLGHVTELWKGVPGASPGTRVPRGTLEAGRWLRDHSTPDDVVATNAVCFPSPTGACAVGHFSVTAYAERRVLVESWIYIMRTHALAARWHIADTLVPFWDRRRLADDLAAFDHPSAAAVRRLGERYGVRWLLADRGQDPRVGGLGRFARLRYTAGDWAVYEIPA